MPSRRLPLGPDYEGKDFLNRNFSVYACDGGEHSPSYSPSNVLLSDTSCYSSTKRLNINLILQFMHPAPLPSASAPPLSSSAFPVLLPPPPPPPASVLSLLSALFHSEPPVDMDLDAPSLPMSQSMDEYMQTFRSQRPPSEMRSESGGHPARAPESQPEFTRRQHFVYRNSNGGISIGADDDSDEQSAGDAGDAGGYGNADSLNLLRGLMFHARQRAAARAEPEERSRWTRTASPRSIPYRPAQPLVPSEPSGTSSMQGFGSHAEPGENKAGSSLAAAPSCVVTEIIIRSPESGFTSPAKEGLIFMSYDRPDIEATRVYDDISERDFNLRYRSLSGLDKECGRHPVAYFRVDDRTHLATVRLPFPRTVRFIHIKLLRSHEMADNIDLQFVGLKGFFHPPGFASFETR